MVSDSEAGHQASDPGGSSARRWPLSSRRQRRLGQNFLADTNLLDAIVSDARLAPDDIVLEVGGGDGALTSRLVEECRLVHLVEIDRGLECELEPIASETGKVSIIWGDALKVDLSSLVPAPTKMVANLPYAIATPLLIRTVVELPTISRWVVMVQREIAERLTAAPGTKAYGAPSAVIGSGCEVDELRRVDPAVFIPRPRVGSSLISIERTGPPPDPRVQGLIRDGFAHRRKALARSLELSDPGSGESARRSLVAMGLAPDARAETLSPEQFVRLAAEMGVTA